MRGAGGTPWRGPRRRTGRRRPRWPPSRRALRAHVAAVGLLEDATYRELLAGLIAERRRGRGRAAARARAPARTVRLPGPAADAHAPTTHARRAAFSPRACAPRRALAAAPRAAARGRVRRGRAPARPVAARDGRRARVRPASLYADPLLVAAARARGRPRRARSRPSSPPWGSGRRARPRRPTSSTSPPQRLARVRRRPRDVLAAAIALEEEPGRALQGRAPRAAGREDRDDRGDDPRRRTPSTCSSWRQTGAG